MAYLGSNPTSSPLTEAQLAFDVATQAELDAAVGSIVSSVNDIFYENAQAVTQSYTIPTGRNAMTAGDITINSGVTVTVSSGSRWVIV